MDTEFLKDILINANEIQLTAYKIAYKQGLKDGIRRYAWWKDGVQYVGTTGTTLQEALNGIDLEEK